MDHAEIVKKPRKKSRRVANTKASIERTYLDILAEHKGKKITVKAVCDRSGVNRTTFYKYYADAEALGQVVRQNLLKDIENLMLETIPGDYADAYEFLSQVVLRAYRDERMRRLFVLYREKPFREAVYEMLEKYYIRPKYGELGSDDQWVLYTFFHAGFVGLMECWLENDMQVPPERVANHVISLAKSIRSA